MKNLEKASFKMIFHLALSRLDIYLYFRRSGDKAFQRRSIGTREIGIWGGNCEHCTNF